LFSQTKNKVVVGAKHFNEGYILSEIISIILEYNGYEVERKFNLGGTAVCFEALKNNEIDVYPEYSGTISKEILKTELFLSLSELKNKLNGIHLDCSDAYGFNNTYSIVLNKSIAEKLKISTISDLRMHPQLKGGLSHEFLNRVDGWFALCNYYQIKAEAKGMEHGLAYKALNNSEIDFTDAYSTDGEIMHHQLSALIDDQNFFPQYQALSLYNNSISLEIKTALAVLKDLISESDMRSMNEEALYKNKSHKEIAENFLIKKGVLKQTSFQKSKIKDMMEHIMQHLFLTFLSVFIAIAIAIPLSIYLYKNQLFLNATLYISGIFQTIPSIALLAFMIPVLGIGNLPAISALSLYAILPILRSSISGLKSIDPQLKEVATSIGMTKNQQLKYLELPLAMPSIVSGIRIASVISIGTATLAAFIGAGGLGEYIVSGLALNNMNLVLKGALPSAILAIVVELIFEWIERKTRPQHLKIK
jgi:osmoprotectant transport system permease protein